MLGLFLQTQGRPLPAYSTSKSPSALSRFFNQSDWSTKAVILAVQAYILVQLLHYRPVGRCPWLQVTVDLITLEKREKYKAFAHLLSLHKPGQQVRLAGLRPVVAIAWVLPQTRWQVGETLWALNPCPQSQHDHLVGQAALADRGVVQNCQASFRAASLWATDFRGDVALADSVFGGLPAGPLGLCVNPTDNEFDRLGQSC